MLLNCRVGFGIYADDNFIHRELSKLKSTEISVSFEGYFFHVVHTHRVALFRQV